MRFCHVLEVEKLLSARVLRAPECGNDDVTNWVEKANYQEHL